MKPLTSTLAGTRARILTALVPLLLAPACSTPDDLPEPNPDPAIGSTDFISADGKAGEPSRGDEPPAAPGPPDEGGDDDGGGREVEEGDIYRVLGAGYLLNLNSYRGLQIIDISDVSAPRITGQLQVSGSPVEMYVVGDRAVVLMNNWRGYYGQRDDVAVDTQEGGLVMVVDIADRSAPVALAQAHVPGWIQTSRLTQGGGQAALYVAASEWAEITNPDGSVEYGTRTVVKSFDVTGSDIVYRTQLDLGGYVTAIQATTDVLMVARASGYWDSEQTEVTVVDISNPDGTMVEGDTVTTAGYVQSQFHMDFYQGTLRVFSGPRWGGGVSSHLETWNAFDLAALTAIDDETFGTGDNLYAAIFRGNKAFAVTYLRIDPFHAFSIDDAGQVTEVSEYEVTGWNDFFRPVLDDTRLIGIGINDENGWQLAVSMYDITNLSNPDPLLARVEVSGSSGGWNWSEANWDHRAFSVLEGAVSVQAPTGELETGLVLLPFSGWNQAQGSTSGVQIYTFSADTLTRRGIMSQSSPVRRSFLADAETAVNLSESELSLFDHTNPDAPAELGRLALAPNYTSILAFDGYRARVVNEASFWYSSAEPPPARVEIVPDGADLQQAAAVASFEIPASAQVIKVGDLLVSVAARLIDGNTWPGTFETTIEVFDLSNPRTPVRRGELVTNALSSSFPSYWYWDCFDCRWWGYQPFHTINVVGDALTFLEATDQETPLGSERVCSTYVSDTPYCNGDCTYYSSDYTCRRLNGGAETCTGGFYRCEQDSSEGKTECEPVAREDVEAQVYEDCYTRDVSRYWQRYTIRAVDLSDPDAPTLTPSVVLPAADEGVSVLASGDRLYVTVKRPVDVPDDPRPYVRYYVKAIDYSDPSAPELAPGVNVPGELIAVDGDRIYTRNLVWGENAAETAIAQLDLDGNLAYLRGHHRFADRVVNSVTIDERGLALVSHRQIWGWGYDYSQDVQRLTILSAGQSGLTRVSEVDVDLWAELRSVVSDRVLFQVPGGLLVLDIEDAAHPAAQAYFATPGWPSAFVIDGQRVLFAAGQYGIYDFDLDTFNLLPPE
jgi:hypothetical protein